jgi:signal transduction histidine kinase
MTSSRPPDVSLYELATRSLASKPLQLSPTTFKSLIGIIFELLIDQQLPATLWLKLPKGELWQTEIEQFCQSATAPYTVYTLQTAQDAPELSRAGHHFAAAETRQPVSVKAEFTELEPQANPFEEAESHFTPPLGSAIYSLPLAADSQLKREYFVLVAAPEFSGFVLAHRPRSIRSQSNSHQELSDKSQTEENLEQKHPLLGLCSFDTSTLELILGGVNQAILCGHAATRSPVEILDGLMDWKTMQATGFATSLNPLLVGHFLTKQVQRQEEIWRSSAIYRRQAEQAGALRQENEELLTTLRLKDEFVKTMGQELRTPLTSMKTALSLLNSPHIKPPQRQRYMDMISRECDRQSLLITSVLDLVQLESTDEETPMEALRLNEIVPGVVSTYQPLAQEKGLMLAYTVPEDLPPVACVNQWLKQIVIHLLHNSIKFTQTGGQVWVKAKQQGELIQLEFRDTGIGISPSDIPKIFDRFYRVRSNGNEPSGVGLGLSIVQELLLRCQGSISVKSKLGEGSVFSVQLPIYQR